MEDFLVKWKGQKSGPHSAEGLRRMFEDREIGPMHEISFQGKWITARSFFRQNSATSPPTNSGPPQEETPAAVLPPTTSQGPIARTDQPIRVTPTATTGSGPTKASPSPAAARDGGTSLLLAGFWQRATALFLDLILIIGLPIWALDAFGPYELFTFSGLLAVPTSAWIIAVTGVLSVFFLYSAILEASPLGGTFGKRAVGLSVVDLSGRPITFPTSALRSIGKMGSAAMLFVGFLIAAYSPRKRAFHDLISGTFVLYPVKASLRF